MLGFFYFVLFLFVFFLFLNSKKIAYLNTHTHRHTHVYTGLFMSVHDRLLTHTHVYTGIYIYSVYMRSWPTVVQGNLKVPFLIAITPRCRGGRYTFPWIASLTLGPCLITLYLMPPCLARRHQVLFLSFWYDSTCDWTPVSRTIGEKEKEREKTR